MDVTKREDHIVARLDPGDEVMATLQQLRDAHDLDGAFFVGIGAVDRATLGHYDVDDEAYTEETVTDQFEVTNFTGNIGPDKIHAHITLGKRDFSTIGGHCADARVSGTFELVILPTGVELSHRPDPTTGLDVFDI